MHDASRGRALVVHQTPGREPHGLRHAETIVGFMLHESRAARRGLSQLMGCETSRRAADARPH